MTLAQPGVRKHCCRCQHVPASACQSACLSDGCPTACLPALHAGPPPADWLADWRPPSLPPSGPGGGTGEAVKGTQGGGEGEGARGGSCPHDPCHSSLPPPLPPSTVRRLTCAVSQPGWTWDCKAG